MTNTAIGLLGGSFDPIHNGHLRIAREAIKQLSLDSLQFIPCHIPPHGKTLVANAADRLHMIKLAIHNEEKFSVNTLELDKHSASYTIETLKTLATPSKTLYFMLGADSFLALDTWHQWQALLDYCHIIVVNRPDYSLVLSDSLQAFYDKHSKNDLETLRQQQCGCIYRLNITPYDISSTQIRNSITEVDNTTEAVKNYIKNKKLYIKKTQ